jgi:glucose/arabinose dehydrogenase
MLCRLGGDYTGARGRLERVHRVLRPGLALGAALLLAGCAGANAAAPPTWIPQPSFAGEGGGGVVPAAPPSAGGPAPSSGPGQPSSRAASPTDPAVVATNLASPVGLTIMPDGSALVGERTTGRIVRVQPEAGQPVTTVRTLPGIDASGDGGLLDLALSPSYAEDGLIFAYETTPTDNRVVDFTLTGPITPVLTGIPKGASDNSGRLVFGADGDLYVGTGDAGSPALAADPTSLAGKVLRVSDIGKPAAGNPTASSPVFTSGHHVVDGLCLVDDGSDTVVEVEAQGAGGTDNVNVLQAGDSYGWPDRGPSAHGPLVTLPAADAAPGGCAVLDDTLYVTSLSGKSLVATKLTSTGGSLSAAAFTPILQNKYGRLRTVVAAPDGALWMTTSNRDGHGTPVATDERVIRIMPSGGASANFPG